MISKLISSKHEYDTGTAVAIGVVLATSVSLPVGVGVGTALLLISRRDKNGMTSMEDVYFLAIAIAVGIFTSALCTILSQWADFEAGFLQGWRGY